MFGIVVVTRVVVVVTGVVVVVVDGVGVLAVVIVVVEENVCCTARSCVQAAHFVARSMCVQRHLDGGSGLLQLVSDLARGFHLPDDLPRRIRLTWLSIVLLQCLAISRWHASKHRCIDKCGAIVDGKRGGNLECGFQHTQAQSQKCVQQA